MEYYSCPTCGTHNEDYVKYCKRCGAWLVGDAKKVVAKKHRGLINTLSTLFFLVIVIGAVAFFLKPEWSDSPSSKNEIVFGDTDIGGQYKVSQLAINFPSGKTPSVAAEFTSKVATKLPLNIKAVFFDGEGKRVGIATTRIGHQLSANSTTTIVFEIEDGSDLKRASNVRIEITSESPLEVLEGLL